MNKLEKTVEAGRLSVRSLSHFRGYCIFLNFEIGGNSKFAVDRDRRGALLLAVGPRLPDGLQVPERAEEAVQGGTCSGYCRTDNLLRKSSRNSV